MKLGKYHLNIGTEDKPRGLCGRKGKYMGYAAKDIFLDLAFDDKCMFCHYRVWDEKYESYWNGSISGQLAKKEIKAI